MNPQRDTCKPPAISSTHITSIGAGRVSMGRGTRSTNANGDRGKPCYEMIPSPSMHIFGSLMIQHKLSGGILATQNQSGKGSDRDLIEDSPPPLGRRWFALMCMFC